MSTPISSDFSRPPSSYSSQDRTVKQIQIALIAATGIGGLLTGFALLNCIPLGWAFPGCLIGGVPFIALIIITVKQCNANHYEFSEVILEDSSNYEFSEEISEDYSLEDLDENPEEPEFERVPLDYDPFQLLPDELLPCIFSFLPEETLYEIPKINKRFLSLEEEIWKILCEKKDYPLRKPEEFTWENWYQIHSGKIFHGNFCPYEVDESATEFTPLALSRNEILFQKTYGEICLFNFTTDEYQYFKCDAEAGLGFYEHGIISCDLGKINIRNFEDSETLKINFDEGIHCSCMGVRENFLFVGLDKKLNVGAKHLSPYQMWIFDLNQKKAEPVKKVDCSFLKEPFDYAKLLIRNKYIVIESEEEWISVLDKENDYKLLWNLQGRLSTTVSEDVIITAGSRDKIIITKLEDGKCLKTFSIKDLIEDKTRKININCLEAQRDLLFVGADTDIIVVNWKTEEVLNSIPLENKIKRISVTDDLIACVGKKGISVLIPESVDKEDKEYSFEAIAAE